MNTGKMRGIAAGEDDDRADITSRPHASLVVRFAPLE